MEKAVAEAKEHRRMRTLPIDGVTRQVLQDFIERGGPVRKEDRFLLFPINRHRAWQIVTDCADRAGLPKLINPETGKLHSQSAQTA